MFSFSALFKEVLELAPSITAAVFKDKATMPNESRLAATTQAISQASQVFAQIEPNDAATINEANAGIASIVSALQTSPPAPVAATSAPVPVAGIVASTSGAKFRIVPKALTLEVGEKTQFTLEPVPPAGSVVAYALTGDSTGATVTKDGALDATATGSSSVIVSVNGQIADNATVTVIPVA